MRIKCLYLQWCAGLLAFFIPQTPLRFRSRFLPVHVTFGNFIFLLVVVVCVSGITEKNISRGQLVFILFLLLNLCMKLYKC